MYRKQFVFINVLFFLNMFILTSVPNTLLLKTQVIIKKIIPTLIISFFFS